MALGEGLGGVKATSRFSAVSLTVIRGLHCLDPPVPRSGDKRAETIANAGHRAGCGSSGALCLLGTSLCIEDFFAQRGTVRDVKRSFRFSIPVFLPATACSIGK